MCIIASAAFAWPEHIRSQRTVSAQIDPRTGEFRLMQDLRTCLTIA